MTKRITEMIRAATGGENPGKRSGQSATFAKTIGTTPATVSRWRSGSVPDPSWWPGLARYFKATEAEIAEACDGQPSLEDRLSQLVDGLDYLTSLVQEQLEEMRHNHAQLVRALRPPRRRGGGASS